MKMNDHFESIWSRTLINEKYKKTLKINRIIIIIIIMRRIV